MSNTPFLGTKPFQPTIYRASLVLSQCRFI
nr:MAG TPA: hypothetical protein [Caudoviricetes sp.]